MNKNLGKFLLLFVILWHVEGFASTYTWHGEADKQTAFVHEAIYLKYWCAFSDRAELYSIEFNPVGMHEKYSVKLLSQSSKIEDGKKVVYYEFVAFAKVAGSVSFDFDMVMKKTNKESIENTVIGRDNLEKEEFSTKVMRQESLVVEVKETQSDLVGTFVMKVQKDAPQVKAYEPYHVEIVIEGRGDFEALKPYEFAIEGVKVFSQQPTQNIKLTKDGFVGIWSQKFAFVSDKNFEIPPIQREYFDLGAQHIKKLDFESVAVEVLQGFEEEELLDADNGEVSFFRWEHLYYFLTFIAGFMVAKIKIRYSAPHANTNSFKQKLQSAKTLEELCLMLILKDGKKYSDFMVKIEKKEITSLKEAKKTLENLIAD